MSKLDYSQVTVRCSPIAFNFTTTEETLPLKDTIGQERAIKAIEIALNMRTKGYNLYLAGPRGVGKTSSIKSTLDGRVYLEPTPPDIIYIYNFSIPESPKPLILKPGLGKKLSQELANFIQDVKYNIPQIFESEDYDSKKNMILKKAQQKMESAIHKIQILANSLDIALQVTPQGILTAPIKDGKVLSPDLYETLNDEEKKSWELKNNKIIDEINQTLRINKKIEKESTTELKQLDTELIKELLTNISQDIKSLFSEEPDIVHYLNDIEEDILININLFKPTKENIVQASMPVIANIDPYAKYSVNVMVDNSTTKGAPIVIENNPTYYNLIGKIEFKSQLGFATTSFDLIKPGSLIKANGGYLIIQVEDIMNHLMAWEALKKSLENNQVAIENIGEQFRTDPVVTLKPEPVPINNYKVILIGSLAQYYLLFNYDEGFRKLFKIRADFDTEMDRNVDSLNNYASFICSRIQTEGLNMFTREAVMKIVDYSSRLAEHQEKLSTKFSDIAALVSESDYWSKKESKSIVDDKDVVKAINEKIFRSNLLEDKFNDLIHKKTIIINTKGSAIGQINGLSLLSFADYSFGKPSRITASVSLGTQGIMNIEREVAMSGPIHSKGILILTGFLRDRFARDFPLSLTASLVFEQLYDEIEGDSASSAELYTLLSAITKIPIKQGIAVTGSINQKGEIQAVGGVTHKVEGFYNICKESGLTGDQGVIIPYQNIKNLVLRDEIVEAIKNGMFHIYAIKNVDEGIELLTSLKAGNLDDKGNYMKDTFYYHLNRELEKLALLLKDYQKVKPK